MKKTDALHFRINKAGMLLLLLSVFLFSICTCAADETLTYRADAVMGSGTDQNTTGGEIRYRIDWTQLINGEECMYDILVLSGQGQLKDYELPVACQPKLAPWYYGDCGQYMPLAAYILVEEGITGLGTGISIGKGLDNLMQVYLPRSLTKIGKCAFWCCSHLRKVVIPGMQVDIDQEAFYQCSTGLTIYCNTGSTAQAYAEQYKIRYVLMDKAAPAVTTQSAQQTSEGSVQSAQSSSTDTAQAGQNASAGTTQSGQNTSSGTTQAGQKPAVTAPAVCSHVFSTCKVTKKPTVFRTGLKKCSCTLCGKTTTEKIPTLKPVLKLSKTKIVLRQGKKSGYITVKKIANGDSVVSVKSSSTKIVKVINRSKKRFRLKAGKTAGRAYVTVKLKSGKTAKIRVKVRPAAHP